MGAEDWNVVWLFVGILVGWSIAMVGAWLGYTLTKR